MIYIIRIMKVLRIKGFCYRLTNTNVRQHDEKIKKKNNVYDLDLSLHNKF